MKGIIYQKWFPWFCLGCALLASLMWYVAGDELLWAPLFVAIAPWMARVANGRFPFRRTPLDVGLWVFMLTALLAVWTAYDTVQAWHKFYILLGGVFIYYALAEIRRRDLWLVMGGTAVFSAALAGYFLLTNDWAAWPADIAILNRIGGFIMRLRPAIRRLPVMHPNTAGGILAMLVPLWVAFGWRSWQRRKKLFVRGTAVCGAISLIALLLTSSRGAWLALFIALTIWGLWAWGNKLGLPISRHKLVLGGTALLIVAILFFSFLFFGDITAIVGSVAATTEETSRLELFQQTLYLIADYPFTGSGLATFPAQFSQYIVVMPVLWVVYSNFYLDIWLEQTILGLLAFVLVWGGAVWLLTFSRPVSPPVFKETDRERKRRRRERRYRRTQKDLRLFRWALFAALLVMGIHGLTDDALYGHLGTPLVWFLPGLAVAISGYSGHYSKRVWNDWPTKWIRIGLGATTLVGIGILLFFGQLAMAAWQANLGALEMARVDLAGWPTNRWDEGQNVGALAPAEERFMMALAVNPENMTAQYRLGLSAMLHRDYETAVSHLAHAWQLCPPHRGIRKALGYSYVWLGDVETALPLLRDIPEAQREMSIYADWWQRQGYPEFAHNATIMSTMLEQTSPPEKRPFSPANKNR
ncbi:MAG: hypothetical protein D6706_10785 [Chloroflexi bacterium]|nr:MAG: hypothetical protein D6706_10785 [Chloroflexota bacterium]